MKKILVVILIYLGVSNATFSQTCGWVLASCNQNIASSIILGKRIQLPEELTYITQQFLISEIEHAFPYSKIDLLINSIAFRTSLPIELTEHLLKYHKNIFSLVEYELDQECVLDYVPSDYFWNKKKLMGSYTPVLQDSIEYLWHIKKIQTDKAWNITKSNSNTIIAVIDENFYGYHYDLAGKINNKDPYDNSNIYQSTSSMTNTHGLQVASLAAGITNGGGYSSSVGFNSGLIAYNANKPPYNVLNFVNKAHHASLILNSKVINFSLGNFTSAGQNTTLISTLVKEILDNGTIIVRSAGNRLTDSDANRYPFSYSIDERIIIVGSTDFFDNYTNPTGINPGPRYPQISICAPGYGLTTASVSVYPPIPYLHYHHESDGSSFASAIVSGVCALIKSIAPDLSVADVKEIIQSTADPIVDEIYYHGLVGSGRINAFKAVCKALSYQKPDTIFCNMIWDRARQYSSNIVIMPNVELVIDSIVHLPSSGSIIVHPGGKLTIDGGTLTNACDGEMWQGVIVYGNTELNDDYSNQSIVEIINSGKINNALCGILSLDNAKITATNASFINNRESITIGSLFGAHNYDIASITNSTFVINNNYLADPLDFEAHIRIFGNAKIKITNSSLANYASAKSYQQNKNCGIYAINAQIELKSSSTNSNLFYGFNQGVNIANATGSASIKISRINFEGNRIAVLINGVNYPTISSNNYQFGIPGIYPPPIFYPTNATIKGVSVANSTGFLIRNNHFNCSHPHSGGLIGLEIFNSGAAENRTYKNRFTNLKIGQFFDGINAGSSQSQKATGLQFLCNFNANNSNCDVLVGSNIGGLTHRIRKHQGSSITPAGNEFTQIDTTVINLISPHITSFSSDTIYYYYSQANNHLPRFTSSFVKVLGTNSYNLCDLYVGVEDSIDSDFDIDWALAQYDIWNSEYEFWFEKLNNYSGNDGSEYDYLEQQISYYSALKDNYFNEILQLAISDERLPINKHLFGISDLFAYRGQYQDYLSITEAFMAVQKFDDAIATLNQIPILFVLESHQKQELTGFKTYINWLAHLNLQNQTIYQLTEKEVNYLRTFVENHVGRGAVFAQNILCMLHNICPEETEITANERKDVGAKKLKEGTTSVVESVYAPTNSVTNFVLSKITITPNPTTGELRINNGECKIIKVEILDLTGKKLQTINDERLTINIAHLKAGIYFVKIITDNGEVVRKVVKQ